MQRLCMRKCGVRQVYLSTVQAVRRLLWALVPDNLCALPAAKPSCKDGQYVQMECVSNSIQPSQDLDRSLRPANASKLSEVKGLFRVNQRWNNLFTTCTSPSSPRPSRTMSSPPWPCGTRSTLLPPSVGPCLHGNAFTGRRR